MIRPTLIKCYKIFCLSILGLIALGGGVRVMDAGLACPDWPLCFGQWIPDFHIQVYFEYIHRVYAGLIALAALVLNIYILKTKTTKKWIKYLISLVFFVLTVQIIMGGLTVLWQLQAYTVTTHFMLALVLVSASFLIYFDLKASNTETPLKKTTSHLYKILFSATLLILGLTFVQLFLGSLVASHYAGLACMDFPLCHGQWFPSFQGVIGLQVMHRLGAYILFTTTIIYSIFMLRKLDFNLKATKSIKHSIYVLMILICAQVSLGILNILFKIPPILAVLHLLGGVCIFLILIKILFNITLLKSLFDS